MPRIRSSQKRMRQSRARAQHNRALRSAIKTAVKKARAEVTPANVAAAMRALDRGARKRIIHRNAAARKKARLARRLAQTRA